MPGPPRIPVLAVDAGRSNCRVALFTAAAGGGLASGAPAVRPSRATAVDPGGPAQVAATIAEAVAQLPGAAPGAAAVAVAAAGALSLPAAAALADQLARRYGEVAVTSDVVAAHAGAFDGDPGVVLAVGTGAVAFAVGADGRHTVVDGGGYLVGDAGSGFTIGRAGLAAALRHADGRDGGSAALAAAARDRFGSLPELPYRLHAAPDPARRVASFTPEVVTAARAGDPVAGAIWRDAAGQLAQTVAAACRSLPAEGCEVALVGPLFELDDLLTTPLRERLAQRCPQATVRGGSTQTLLGAARLARPRTPGYEPLVVRRKIRSAG